jgi:hypothetical protein
MKKLVTFFMISIAFLSTQCTSSDNNSNQVNRMITQEMLDEKKAEVLAFINNSTCTGSCNYIAFGSKPCGGPREYLLFSSSVSQGPLVDLVAEYNEMEHQFNIQTNAVSDCMMVLPPASVECVNGNCVIIN